MICLWCRGESGHFDWCDLFAAPKHTQDAPRTDSQAFEIDDPHPGKKPKKVKVVYASFAACIEREANQKGQP